MRSGDVLAVVEFAQHFEHALLEHRLRRLQQLPARMVEGFAEALLVDRLQQVVERMHLEGAHGVTVVGGDKNGQRQSALLLQRLHYAEAVDFGHLDVEEDQVWLLALDSGDGRAAVTALGHDFQVGFFLQQAAQTPAGKGFVVAKQYSNRHGRS